MIILVTGGSGFLGTELIKTLINLGHTTFNIDKEKPLGQDNFICHDLTFPLNNDFGHIDVCIHLASGAGGILYNQKSDMVEYNQMINNNVYDICSKHNIPHFVFVSSLNALEKSTTDFHKISTIAPDNTYARSKWEGEKFFMNKFKHLSIIRPANIFGKSQMFKKYGESHVIPDIMHKIIESQNSGQIEVWGDGSQIRNFIHVSDLCNFIVSILEDNHTYKIFNAMSNINCSISDLTNELMDFLQIYPRIIFKKDYMKYETMSFQKIFDKVVPFGKITSIKEGLKI